ncbi:chemotaxis protein CheW [uncultured Oscillibacter sp.]|uniref:chemotaxis protein CheW n=1 Tax=uncultured Oscillibacter sp. TaxID=876091 RepID=UPI00280A88B3|nr:chemotaxis protein CheW [uncultured Oscillibacter sp.]
MTEQDLLFQTEDQLSPEPTEEVQTEKHLLFQSSGLLFGVPASQVVEIITNHVITWVPLLPNHVRGVINLRGQILPILDIRRLLSQEEQDNTCIIILQADAEQVGILVDQVEKMVDVDISAILPAPPRSAQKLVSGMCSLDDSQTMMVFDCARLLEHA